MAGRCGVVLRSYGRWEKGDAEPSASALVALAASGLDVQYILTGKVLDAALRESFRLAAVATVQAGDAQIAALYIQSLPGLATAVYKPPIDLNAREEKLITNFRAADESGKKAVEQAAAALAKSKG